MSIEPFSVLILAGGRSQRLGRDKTQVRLGEQTLLQATVDRVSALTDDLVIVVRQEQSAPQGPWRVAHDAAADGGLVAALAGGLAAARHRWTLAIAGDMPFVSAALVHHLASLADGWQAVIPSCERGLEPLHALYRADVLTLLMTAVQQGERRLSAALSALGCRFVPEAEWRPYDPQGRSFLNVNTPADLTLAQRLLGAD